MKTGFVGLGAMGAPMALNLHRAGCLVAGWNRTPARAESLVREHGLPLVATLAELARRSELVIVCVSRDADVRSVVQQLVPGLREQAVVVDCSTVGAQTERELAPMLAAGGVHLLDAPVSGGVEGAQKGTLAMMVGGDAALLERVRPTLSHVASNIRHMGPLGSGQQTKAVNQIMVAGIAQAVSEALAFGAAAGLQMDRVLDIVSRGAAGSWFLEHRGAGMLAGSFDVGFRLALHHKDLEICRTMAREVGVEVPLVEQTMRDYERLMADGRGDEDVSALFRLKSR